MKVSVIGLGYVGSVAAAGLASAGHDVLGIDVDVEKISSLRDGKIPFYEPGLSELVSTSIEGHNLRILHSEEVTEHLGEIIYICVGTPSTITGSVDLGYVKEALSWVIRKQPEGGIIVMKSTVPPGTGMRLSESYLRDTNFDYISNPEFLREGQALDDWFHPDRIVLGSRDHRAIVLLNDLFKGIESPIVECDITSAEMIKYAANAFLATKISFINEIASLCDRLGATIDEVAHGIALDPRIGSSFLNAGVGYGGSCFPKDTRALDDLALTIGHNFELLRSVITVNSRQRLLPIFSLRERFGSLSGVNVGILGLSFKPNTDDVRESPSIELIKAVMEEGAVVSVYDPKAQESAARVLPQNVRFASNPISCSDNAQAIILMTEWPEIVDADWELISEVCKFPRFLFDGRNALDPDRMNQMGFQYTGVGRGKNRIKNIMAGVKR